MVRVVIKPAWVLSSESGDRFEPQFFRLLRAIHDTGKLTHAAKAVSLSYRHAWDLLLRWAEIFGADLVVLERGRGARLTPLGEKLLWAEQRTEAGLFPHLQNVAAELNDAIGKARELSTPVLRLNASHGYAIEKVPAAVRSAGGTEIDLKYMGSVEALAALHRGDCDIAGFHVPLGNLGPILWAPYARWFKARQQRIIRLVIRTQGFIVRPGNPLAIHSLRDLLRREVRFVNRQAGSGTRILLDGLLRANRLDPERINGYGTGEFTHAAVAAFVASGMADVGLGIEPAARQFKLDFVPIARERYMLTCKNGLLETPAIASLCDVLRSEAYARIMAEVPGYEPDHPGEVVVGESVFPWLKKERRR